MTTYNKLVRDKIPEILDKKGAPYEKRIASTKLQAARIFIGLNACILITQYGRRYFVDFIWASGSEPSENPFYIILSTLSALQLPAALLCLIFGIIVLSSIGSIWRESSSTMHVLLILSFILSLLYVGSFILFFMALSMMNM